MFKGFFVVVTLFQIYIQALNKLKLNLLFVLHIAGTKNFYDIGPIRILTPKNLVIAKRANNGEAYRLLTEKRGYLLLVEISGRTS